MQARVLVQFGAFHLDEANAMLRRAGRAVDLQPKELAVLCELARRPGQLVTKDQLLDAVWGHQHVSESVLKTIVSHLRAALDDDAREPRCIETVSRRGYRFVAALQGAPQVPAVQGPRSMPVSPVPASPLPAPPVPAGTPLVGRGAALASLQRAMQAAHARRRQLVFVAGEAGIGKTALIDGFAATAAAAGAHVARGQCVEHYGAGEPYMPVLEALDALVRHDAEWRALARRVAPSWLVQMPWHLADDERRELLREVAGGTQERMLREMGELLDRGCERAPLVLVLEDLHWSDHATVQLLGYLARRRTPAALLVLASLRPAEVIAESHPLSGVRQELRAQRLAEEIDLELLSEADVGELLQQRLAELAAAAAPNEAFVLALHTHTGGLPLFVANLIDELLDAAPAAAGRAGDGWRLPDAAALTVPSRIADVLAMRFGRLGAELQQVLAVASVAGAEFQHLPLAEAMHVDARALLQLLDAEAARGGWLHAGGVTTLPGGRDSARFAFRHGLYRDVLYQRLSAAEKVRWHRALGQVLLALQDTGSGEPAGESAGELALHFERGQRPLAAMLQYVQVGRRALFRSAPHEALLAVQQGLALRDAAQQAAAGGTDATAVLEAELDLRVLQGVAASRVHVLLSPQVVQVLERTRALVECVPPGPARARAQHALWWVSFGRGELREAERLARQLLDAAAASGEASLLLVGSSAMGMTMSLSGRLPEAREHLERALATRDTLGDALPSGLFVLEPGVEARAHLAVVCWWQGEPRLARRHAAEAVQRAFAIRHYVSQIVALLMDAAMHLFAGELAEARQRTERLFEVVREQGLPKTPGTFSWLHGRALAAAGEVDAGLALMREGEAACRAIGQLGAITGFHYHLAEACAAAQRPDDALAAADEGLALAEGGPEQYVLAPLHRVRAELLAARGEREAAQAALQAALATARRQQARFHELHVLASGLRLALLPATEARARLAELLPAYEGEQIALAREARELLAG
ncbi:MAG: AAA family ATPase [Rubrivivax sp.]|nr:AAA family ATPase [Rubrivivax sp.]